MFTPIEKIRAALAANPNLSSDALAKAVGISRQWVYETCKANGIVLKRKRPVFTPIAKNERGSRLSPAVVGGMSELLVCADLLRRGAGVYRSVTYTSSADLIADFQGELLRIEVRSATRSAGGKSQKWQYTQPGDHSAYDVLALVDKAGEIKYVPPFADAKDP